MSLSIELIDHVDQLSAEHLDRWNQLARTPLQRWEWLGSWWNAYQSRYNLYVLAVKRSDRLIAFAPWCMESRLGTGRTIQFLGSGKACTDHQSLLVDDSDVPEVCDAIAEWLGDAAIREMLSAAEIPIWDSIELIGVDASDKPINCLTESMRASGLEVDTREGQGCYVVDLPDRWDDYVQNRSKSGRREIRQSLQNIDNGAIIVERIEDREQLENSWDYFVALHQRRRHASGTTGCFDHPPFGVFLREAASKLLDAGLLQVLIASCDGVPVAAQFAVVDRDTLYYYQSGMEPDASELRPGLSLFAYAIRESINDGKKRFDMMRGDEPYKLRWRASLVPAQEVRVCSPRPAAQFRNQFYRVGVTVKNFVKSGLGIGQRCH